MHDLVIVGAGGHGRETLDVVEAINAASDSWNFLGFVDDGDVPAERLERRGADVLGPTGWLLDWGQTSEHETPSYAIGIGSSTVRAEVDATLTGWGLAAVSLVHPLASVASDNHLGQGALLAAGARVTTNVTLGRHVHLNVNAVVSHDSVVGDHSTLSPGVHLNGEVSVGERVFFGTGAIVTPGVSIGNDAVIGAGAVVVRDIPNGVTAMGVPARW